MTAFLKLDPAQIDALLEKLNRYNAASRGPYEKQGHWHIGLHIEAAEVKITRPPAKPPKNPGERRYVRLSEEDVSGALSDSLSELQDRSMSGAAYDAIAAALRRNDGTEIFLHHQEDNGEGENDWVLAVASGKKVYQLYGLHAEDEFVSIIEPKQQA